MLTYTGLSEAEFLRNYRALSEEGKRRISDYLIFTLEQEREKAKTETRGKLKVIKGKAEAL